MVDQQVGIFLYESETIEHKQLIMIPGVITRILFPIIVEEKVEGVLVEKNIYNIQMTRKEFGIFPCEIN